MFAGPSAGKSTVAASIYSELKRRGKNVELAREYIKDWAYINRRPVSFDQCYVFAKQLHAEDLLFQGGVKSIITDSPINLAVCYAKAFGCPFWKDLFNISKEFDNKHPPLNIFLDRGNLEYKLGGRYETYEEALLADKRILDFLDEQQQAYKRFSTQDIAGILAELEFLE